jgi:hypothetical protein
VEGGKDRGRKREREEKGVGGRKREREEEGAGGRGKRGVK